MRRESLFFGILTLVVSAFLTGCSDDDTEVYVPQRVAEFNLSDESDGNRLFIIYPLRRQRQMCIRDRSWKAQRRITPRAICTTWARR